MAITLEPAGVQDRWPSICRLKTPSSSRRGNKQSGECREDLYARVDSKIARSDLSQLNRIVVLGADGPRDVALSDVFSDIRRSSGADISALRLSVRHHLGEG